MFTPTQLEAIRDKALAKADWFASAPQPRNDNEFFRQQRARLVSEMRHIAADALFLIDTPDCDDTLASIEQALDAWPELDAVAQENCAAALAHRASMTPEYRSRLDGEWAA